MRHIILVICGIAFCTSCARQISSEVYAARQVGEISTTYAGVIVNVRPVMIENSDQLEENSLGIAGGGLLGGAVGNAAGRGRFLPTAAGAIAGAVAGSLVEQRLKEQSGLEYVVQLDNGNLITVVQGSDQLFNVGQPVYLIVSQGGRSRITPQ